MPRFRPRRPALAAAGTLTALLTALAGTGPVQAAPTTAAPTGQLSAAPAAPSLQERAAALAAGSPTVSPAAPFGHVPADSDYQCAAGTLCTLVWDPTAGDYKIFYLTACARYSLDGWSGQGFYADNRTPGTRSVFYGANGRVLKSFTPDGGANHQQDWTPVRAIRTC
ncbi:hypothetical protein ABT093_37360 [Kitasatospora sp. NPDC002551]|uniref:hypothetical protein n=1 Tax=unclassified Kitasatospora TaxID=2633591 RepID=UPI0033208062